MSGGDRCDKDSTGFPFLNPKAGVSIHLLCSVSDSSAHFFLLCDRLPGCFLLSFRSLLFSISTSHVMNVIFGWLWDTHRVVTACSLTGSEDPWPGPQLETLFCQLKALCLAHSYIWKKDNVTITPSSSSRIVVGKDGSLLISQTWSGDIGDYTCDIRSEGGNDSRVARLEVM